MTKEIKTRELLRNFKEVKKDLLTGKVKEVIVDLPEGQKIIVKLQKKEGNIKTILANLPLYKPEKSFKRPNLEGLINYERVSRIAKLSSRHKLSDIFN
jgi:sporulation protein YlmC with PRC-barrel domain